MHVPYHEFEICFATHRTDAPSYFTMVSFDSFAGKQSSPRAVGRVHLHIVMLDSEVG